MSVSLPSTAGQKESQMDGNHRPVGAVVHTTHSWDRAGLVFEEAAHSFSTETHTPKWLSEDALATGGLGPDWNRPKIKQYNNLHKLLEAIDCHGTFAKLGSP